jgi:hypothetical protein
MMAVCKLSPITGFMCFWIWIHSTLKLNRIILNGVIINSKLSQPSSMSFGVMIISLGFSSRMRYPLQPFPFCSPVSRVAGADVRRLQQPMERMRRRM